MHEDLTTAMKSGQFFHAIKLINQIKPEDFIENRVPNPAIPWVPINSPFHVAAELGQNNLIELMLKKNPKLADYKPHQHNLALYPATRDGNVELVKLLLSYMSAPVITQAAQEMFGSALNQKQEKVLEQLLANPDIIKGANNYNNKGIIANLEENGYAKLGGIIPPANLIKMLNPMDRALDSKCVESLYKALFFYDLDINFHPEVAENYYRKGNILYAIGKKDEAFQCYDKALTADSTYAPKIGFNIHFFNRLSELRNINKYPTPEDFIANYKSKL